MSIVLAAVTLLLAVAAFAAVTKARIVSILLASPILGVMTYVTLGITIARVRGEGQFYSFPIGGYRVADGPLLLSVLIWAGMWAVLLGVAGSFANRPPTSPPA